MEKNDCSDGSCNFDLQSDLRNNIIRTLSPYHEQTDIWHRKNVEKKADELLEVFRKWIHDFKISP